MAEKKKRARTAKGHYQKDDPSTPDINEAYVQEEVVKVVKPIKPQTVWYESREKEPSMFPVADINCIRNFNSGRLEWEVDADDVERFEQHHFVMNARVVRKR
tara:strand:- start:84 stop:389 length:306 start_codon:yes stop_codon:yes gene_type:complete